jgi:ATP phosphoribosyltransferase
MTEGRLNQATLNLLEGVDIQFRRENRLDIALVKNLPIALVFLPAADIPTFVGEGRVDLGITGWDQVQEHDAGVREYNRTRRSSISSGSNSTTANGVVVSADDPLKTAGSVKRLDLEFGYCKLQVQVPERGRYETTNDLVGKVVGTSFVHLAAEHFAKLELQMEGKTLDDSGEAVPPKKLRTKIIELSGSVEAACALGVADGIVDLVGKDFLTGFFEPETYQDTFD